MLLPLDEKKVFCRLLQLLNLKTEPRRILSQPTGKVPERTCWKQQLWGKFKGHLHVSGKPWEGSERGGILDSLLYGESKNVREDPGDHISSHSSRGPCGLLAAGPQEVKGQWTTGVALSHACRVEAIQQLYFWKWPQKWKRFCLWDPPFPPWVQIEVRQKVGHWPSRWTQPRLDGAKCEPWGVSV